MDKTVYLTKEGLQKLKDELSYLINVERANIIKRVVEAREKGDLSENAEYKFAREAQRLLEDKISKLQKILNNARVIEYDNFDCSEVRIFTTVEVKNLKDNSVLKYTLVSENEANLKEGKISVTSPIGKGLLGKKVGDVVTIKIPIGEVKLKILNISV